MADSTSWPTIRLGDVATFRNGINFNKDSFGTGIKVLGVSDFQDYLKPHYEELDQINPKGIVSERNILKDGDIVFVRSNGNRELIGRSLFIQNPPEEITHSAFTIRLRFNSPDVFPRFYAYCFRTQIIRKSLTAYGGGTNISNLNQDILSALEVPMPPLETQQKLTGILNAYDELIENNQRRIRILEEIARRLYREWFVHFRFPGHENHPRVPSPLGEIPQGWRVTTLGDLYETRSGGTPSRRQPEYFQNGTIDWVKSQELLDGFILSAEERITEQAMQNSSAKRFARGTVLIAIYGATIGKLGILANDAATNQAVCGFFVRSRPFGSEFAFFTLLENRDRIIGMRLGAAQQNISQVILRNFEIITPSDELVAKFSAHVSGLMNQILNLQRQNQNLRRTRDLLLPRLFSGQIQLEAN